MSIYSLFNLSGKVAIVTGGNGGIGLGIAKGLAQAGANIAIASRNSKKTNEAVDLLQSLGVEAIGTSTNVDYEQSVEAAVESTVNHFGKIDILVNNAGITIRKKPEEYTFGEWQQVISTNLNGTFLFCKSVYPHMAKAKTGKIINIGSMSSIFGLDTSSPYAATKGAIVQLSKSLAMAWAKDNIQVNTILPGWIRTDLTAPMKELFPERYSMINSRIPSHQWGEPDDFAGTAVLLSSDASAYITGASIPVDGGYSSVMF